MAVLEENFMISLAEAAVKAAMERRAQEAEAYVYEGQATNVGIELGQVSKSNRIVDRGLGIRVISEKRAGFAYTNIIEDSRSISNIAENALSAARASKPDLEWKELPKKKEYCLAERTFDTRIVDLNSEDLVRAASTMLDAAQEADARVFPIEGGVGGGYVSTAIANSNGVLAFDKGTFVECSLATIAKDGGLVTPVCFEFSAAREYDFDPSWVGHEAAKLALSALKTKPIKSKSCKVIFTQFALQELLVYTLVNAIKADNVQRGQSPLEGKLGQEIASEKITIYDDGLLSGGLRTSVFDGEGIPHQKTVVIERGVLRNFLFDNYSAKKEGKESTGNASRAGYLSTPSIDTTNFHIMPGGASADQMISEVDDGLIIYFLQGAHSSNPVSGDFSVVATPAWKIEKGEIVHCSRGVMLAGNIFELIKKVSLVGSNERQMGSFVSPWVTFEDVKVIGK